MRLMLGSGALTFAFLALLFPFGGSRQPAFTRGSWVLLPMASAAVLAVAAGWAALRWSSTAGWDDRRLLASASGALVAHTPFGTLSIHLSAADRVGLIAVGVVMALALARLAQLVSARDPRPERPGPVANP